MLLKISDQMQLVPVAAGLKRGSMATRLLELRVIIHPGPWKSVSCRALCVVR